MVHEARKLAAGARCPDATRVRPPSLASIAGRALAALVLPMAVGLAGSPAARAGEEARPPGAASEHPALERRLEEVLATPGYRHGHWGILVVDARTGKVVYERNPDELFAPASVTKLFSTAAALAELGADFRFETPVVRTGEVDGHGVLNGDLVLVARGDLNMGGRMGPDGTLLFRDDDHTYAGGNPRSDVVEADPLAGLDHLAAEVRAAGVRRVTGDVRIDDRLFEPAESTGSGPRRLAPILINDNVVDVLVRPGKAPGDPASVSIIPVTSYVAVDAQVETGTAAEGTKVDVRAAGPRRLIIRGRIAADQSRLVLIHEVDDPASFARALFLESLQRRGIRTEASPLGVNSAAGLPPPGELLRRPKVAVCTSPPFRESMKIILKVSHNLHASTLPLLLASRHGERTLDAGLRLQGERLRGLGVDLEAISFGGGAGGSRSDLVTPRATVALLKAMMARGDFADFDAALPILGRDGTLARAVSPESPARGHARAKTGTYWVEDDLTGKSVLTSKALAGYMETAAGRPLILAFFVNNVKLDAPRPGRPVSDATADAGRLLGRLCEILYGSDTPPDDPSPRTAPGASRPSTTAR
ncbi:D-alanyl-D-alanine carboxypeptidase precursor [Aquisphaera giovannonii]|uniref:D-alanyl-D-alanine carboxypeptidase n=1 Tax=Aquisphaera giovannonii TaxID=406548 RepID=A0A5B9WC72_9BACT|nr:D-alanyl-D-alanine carboxypeptidase/D-alanyl-D-alanine-endopeptidase [Aquisphaera giovannonii]QEH38083.1 D-alanyl-D-alanine carboxypeptidase precursor [Aquisphaera giovannonii]